MGSKKIAGVNLEVVWAEFSLKSLTVKLLGVNIISSARKTTSRI
jgi:hypothetical protein